MIRKVIWQLIWRCIVAAPVYAVLLMCFGDPPARVRMWTAVFILFWTAVDVIVAVWRAWLWPWVRLLRLRWPIYRPIPDRGMVLYLPPMSPEDVEEFRKYWRALTAAPREVPIMSAPAPPAAQFIRRGVSLWLAVPMLLIGLIGIAVWLVAAFLPPGFM